MCGKSIIPCQRNGREPKLGFSILFSDMNVNGLSILITIPVKPIA